MVFILGAIVVVILIIVSAIYSKKKHDERVAAFSAWSSQRGFQFYPDGIEVSSGGLFGSLMGGNDSFLGGFQEFSPFGQGDGWRVPMLVTGQEGENGWVIFDYQFDTESTHTDSDGTTHTDRTTHRYSIVALRIPLLFPRIDIRPEGFFDKLGGALGFHDLSFELNDFNRRYYVKAQDEKVAYGLIHPQMIEYLMRIPCRHWQISGNQIVIIEQGWQDIPEIDRIVTDMQDFVKLIPGYMRQDLGVHA